MNVTNLIFVFTASGEVQPWNWGNQPREVDAKQKAQPATSVEKQK
jgi:hypothetical protein